MLYLRSESDKPPLVSVSTRDLGILLGKGDSVLAISILYEVFLGWKFEFMHIVPQMSAYCALE